MPSAGRVACIFTPWALTLASFICLILLELGGWSATSSTLNSLYLFRANFTALDLASAGTLANTTTLTLALTEAKQNNLLRDVYEIHLWNYCSASGVNGTIDYCAPRSSQFYFDPVSVWGLNASATTTTTAAAATASGSTSAVQSAVASAENSTHALETTVLGKAGADALIAYQKVAHWNFIAYEVAFWTTLATLLCSILALFSRWGSFLTWLASAVSTLFTVAAVLTTTILTSTLVGALKTILDPYNISLNIGTHALAVAWLGVAFSLAATAFWLLSVCCCAGRSNPHHRSNTKRGLWNAEPAGYEGGAGRGRKGLRTEKTGGGYARVASPFAAGGGGGGGGERVPLGAYPKQGGAYEPYRHA